MYTNNGCRRLLDYYFVVSCSENGKQQIKRKLGHKSLASRDDREARHALFALKPKIVVHYPTTPHPDSPLLPWVARAAMPRGVRARTKPPAPRFFTFTGWNRDGSKLYGACLEVFERIDVANQEQSIYMPKTLGFVSHYGYFYGFNIFLSCLWHAIPRSLITLEELLMHYFYEIPAPEPKKKIAYDLGRMKVLLACRNYFDIPIMELSNDLFFTQFSKDRVVQTIKLLLLERRVMLVCSDVADLTPMCESLKCLLFPFRWRHLYYSQLSLNAARSLKDYKEPYFVGIPRFLYVRPEVKDSLPRDTMLVLSDRNQITDVDKNQIDASFLPALPLEMENELKDCVHLLSVVLCQPEKHLSRDNILRAYRTMLSFLRKLIYHAFNYDSSPHRDNGFLSEFRKTTNFGSFVEYYKRVNASDRNFVNVYEFYKKQEGLGKQFAKKPPKSAWGEALPSHYKEDAFMIDKDTLRKKEKEKATKKMQAQSVWLKSSMTLAPEFQWTPAARAFYEEHYFSQELEAPKKKKPHRRHVIRNFFRNLRTKISPGKQVQHCVEFEKTLRDRVVSELQLVEMLRKDGDARSRLLKIHKAMTDTTQRERTTRLFKVVFEANEQCERKKKKTLSDGGPMITKIPSIHASAAVMQTAFDGKIPHARIDSEILDSDLKSHVKKTTGSDSLLVHMTGDSSGGGSTGGSGTVTGSMSSEDLGTVPTKLMLKMAMAAASGGRMVDGGGEDLEVDYEEDDDSSSDWETDSEDEEFLMDSMPDPSELSHRRNSSNIRSSQRFRHLNEFEIQKPERKFFEATAKHLSAAIGTGDAEAVDPTKDHFDDAMLKHWMHHAAADVKRKLKIKRASSRTIG